MSRFFLLLSLVTALMVPAFAQELSADEQKALIARLQARRAEMPALTADFTEERTTTFLKTPITSNGTIAFQAPNKFRRELRGKAPSTTVCNGTELWIYYPSLKQAEHYTLGQQRIFDDNIAALTAGLNFQNVEKFFRVAAAHEGTGYKVTLTPRTGSLRRILSSLVVGLDAEGNIQRTDANLPKGDRVVTAYRNVRAAKTSEAKFDFKPPEGVEVSTPMGK